MNKCIWVCVALAAMFVTGESLICNSCKMAIAGKCLFSTTETCTGAQPNCYWGSLTFNVSKWMSMEARGCLATDLCNKTMTGSLLTAGYTSVVTCCNIDRCNGATSIQLSLTAALGAALMVIWSTHAL